MKTITFACIIATGLLVSCNNGDSTSKTDTKDSTMNTSTSTGSTTNSTDSSKKDTSMNSTNNAGNNNVGTTGSNGTAANAGPADAKTVHFVEAAASGGMMEVQLGKMAQDKAKNQRVKDFGNMMNTDHTNANNELKSLASSKNITIPATLSAKDQKHVDMMSKMTGSSFDKAYMDMMVNDHKEDIANFKKAADNLPDADIKNFAAKTLPTLQKHLDSAMAIHHKM